MTATRLFVFGLQSIVSFAAGLAISRRAGVGRAGACVITTLTWAALIVFPAFALGFAHRLSFRALAAASIGTGACALVLLRPSKRDLLRDARALATAPFDVLGLAWERRTLVSLGVVIFPLIWLWFCATAWLAPQDPTTWDTFWYHEPMAAFAIQNRSFEVVRLSEYLQRINGFPRACETIFMWFAMVFGRRLIDVSNLAIVPGLVAAIYLLCRRLSDDVLTCIGFGIVVVTVPGCMMNLQTSHNDPMVAFFLVASFWLATREPLDLLGIALAAIALAISIASKAICVMPVALLSVVVLVRAIRARRRLRVGRAAVAIALGAALVVAMASSVYLRNYLAFHNPFWPEMKVDIPRFGIHWPGRAPYRLEQQPPPVPDAQIDLNIPMSKLVDYMFQIPGSVHDWYFGDAQNYGLGVIWFIVPLLLVALPTLLVDFVRSRRKHGGAPSFPIDRALYLLLVVATAVILFRFTPARWAARYNLMPVTLAIVVVAALAGRPGWRRIGEGACGAAIVCSLMHVWWANPRYWCTWGELKELWPMSSAEREFAGSRTPHITAAFGRLREELLEGDVLVTRHYGLPGLLWNNAYSNRVEYVLDGESMRDYADQRRAIVVVIRNSDPEFAAFRGDQAHWREVTVVNRAYQDFFAFRRVPSAVTN